MGTDCGSTWNDAAFLQKAVGSLVYSLYGRFRKTTPSPVALLPHGDMGRGWAGVRSQKFPEPLLMAHATNDHDFRISQLLVRCMPLC